MQTHYRILRLAILLLWSGATSQGQTVAAAHSRSLEFRNGRWFDGRQFITKTMYSIGGVLQSRKPEHVDSVVDLTDRYVIPPFGEAHNHNVDWSSDEQFARVKRMYLEAGIFYVKNPNNLARAVTPLRDMVNHPGSIDVVFANAGLTASGGHPLGVVERNIKYGGMTKEDADGGFCILIDTIDDLDRKWEILKASRPDFVKTYLLYSEEFAKRKDDTAYFAWKGLDPVLLQEIVRRAHQNNLRVSTHVETAADFHNALIARVDEVNHLPGFRPKEQLGLDRYKISENDAQLAARNNVVVVTTLEGVVNRLFDAQQSEIKDPNAVREMLIHNLLLLNKYGVSIAVGSDSFRKTSLAEALALHRLQVFDNRTLLKMWCETTAKAIFPNRNIGQLNEGYEASFLVLGSDPLQDFAAVLQIELRVKQGEILSLD